MNNKEILVNQIKSWILIDDRQKILQKQLKEIRAKKKELTDNLVQIMKTNEIDCFDINDGKILYKQSKTKVPLNKNTLLESLSKYFENQPNIDTIELGNFLLDNRQIKINENIARK